jgi:GxxExxY protein
LPLNVDPANKPLQQEGYDFMAAAFAVYNEMGHGFTEEIYQEDLERELGSRSMAFVAQPELLVLYKGYPLKKKLRPDLLACDEIIIEVKTVSMLLPEHAAQLLNDLKASGKPVGYLINFGCVDELEWKRFARTRTAPKPISAH